MSLSYVTLRLEEMLAIGMLEYESERKGSLVFDVRMLVPSGKVMVTVRTDWERLGTIVTTYEQVRTLGTQGDAAEDLRWSDRDPAVVKSVLNYAALLHVLDDMASDQLDESRNLAFIHTAKQKKFFL